jgi:hypothetical protein
METVTQCISLHEISNLWGKTAMKFGLPMTEFMAASFLFPAGMAAFIYSL